MKRSTLSLFALTAALVTASTSVAPASERRAPVSTREIPDDIGPQRTRRDVPFPGNLPAGAICVADWQCLTGPCFDHPNGARLCTKSAIGDETCELSFGPGAVAIVVVEPDHASSLCVMQDPAHEYVPPCTADDSCDEGDLCLGNADCGDGYCASTGLFGTAPGQLGVCTAPSCDDECPDDWSCVQVPLSNMDPLLTCVPGGG